MVLGNLGQLQAVVGPSSDFTYSGSPVLVPMRVTEAVVDNR